MTTLWSWLRALFAPQRYGPPPAPTPTPDWLAEHAADQAEARRRIGRLRAELDVKDRDAGARPA